MRREDGVGAEGYEGWVDVGNHGSTVHAESTDTDDFALLLLSRVPSSTLRRYTGFNRMKRREGC